MDFVNVTIDRVQVGSLFGWRCYILCADIGAIGAGDRLSRGDILADTRTMRWEVCYIHPQSGRTLRGAGGSRLPGRCSRLQRRKFADKHK